MKKLGIVIALGLMLTMSACGEPSDKLTSNSWNWEHSRGTDTLELYEDGTYDWGDWGSGKYSIKENKLKLDRKNGATYTYIYEIKGNELILDQEDSSNVFHLDKAN